MTAAFPSPNLFIQRDNVTLEGNSSVGGNSTPNSLIPATGGIELFPNAADTLKDNPALLKDQEAKAKGLEDGSLLESVSGGWWQDIEAEYVLLHYCKSSINFW